MRNLDIEPPQLGPNGFARFGEQVQSRITMLQSRRFGTEIGAPFAPMGDLPLDAQPSNYVSMLYGMGLPGDRALLLAPRPHDPRTPFDHLVVMSNGDQEQFSEFFGPSDEPLRVNDWEPIPGESVRQSFLDHAHLFPVEEALIEEPAAKQGDALFAQALRLAMRRGFAEMGRPAQVVYRRAS